MNFRIKQIGLAICLTMSLLMGHASACMCSHHVEKKAAETLNCHSQHKTANAEAVETANEDNACGTSCICSTNQSSLYAATNPISKKFNATDASANTAKISDIEFQAVSTYNESSQEFVCDISYSNTLESLLPSRAPPRL